MPRDSNDPLPRWGRISKRREAKNDEPLSMEQEECYLRTRMHSALASRVNEALQSTLESQVSPVVDNILKFFQLTLPVENDESTEQRPNKRQRTSDDDPLLALFQMQSSQRYPMTMLPLAALDGPSSFLDRQEMIQFMVNKMLQENKKGKQRAAVCWLRCTGNSSFRHCGPLMQEILRQCIAQEPDPQQFQRLLDRTTKQSIASFSQALLVWAQYTVSFDSIVVVLDTVECIPGPLFQDFLRILTQLRSEQRLPLQVVLLAPPGRRRQIVLDSSTQGTVGILVRDFSLPTSKALYDSMWEDVFIKRPLLSLDSSVLRSLHESFVHHHASAVRAIQMLKQALAHSCMKRGAFLLRKTEPAFAESEKRRIAYFQSHHHSETTLQYAKEATLKHSILSTVLRLLHRICVNVGGAAPSGVEWAEQDFSVSCFNVMRSRIFEHFKNLTKTEKVTWLAGFREELRKAQQFGASSVKDSSLVPRPLEDLVLQLNEIILLVEEADNREEGAFRNDVSQLLSELVYNSSSLGAAIQSYRNEDSNRFSPAATASTTVDGIAPQFRGRFTDALLDAPSALDKSDFTALAPCILFSLMQDRVVISREECFEAFVESFNGGYSLDDLCSAFSFGIHQLCYCGLINEKLGSKNNVLYERTALVWCSGN